MSDEKLIPSFTEQEEMEIYEAYVEKVGIEATIESLAETATLLRIAVQGYKIHNTTCGENAKPLKLAIGIMQTMCSVAEVAIGDTAEQECIAISLMQDALKTAKKGAEAPKAEE